MVFKRSSSKRKSYRRKRVTFKRKSRATTTVVRSPSAFADRTICKLNYCDLLSDNASTLTSSIYRGNDLYDPLYAVGGHQPMGFDQYMTMYGKFTVLGSKIDLRWTSNSTSPITVAVRPTNSATVATYLYEAIERPRTKYQQVSGYECRHTSAYMSTARILGEKKNAIVSEDNFSGTAAASPVNQWYWHIYMNRDAGVTVHAYVWVKLTYYVMFHDRVPMVLS